MYSKLILAISDPKMPKYGKCPPFRNIRLGMLCCLLGFWPLGQNITVVTDSVWSNVPYLVNVSNQSQDLKIKNRSYSHLHEFID